MAMSNVDWATEDAYWRENHVNRPYVVADRGYEHYQPLYKFGFETALKHPNRSWEEIEAELRQGWETPEQHLEGTWDEVKDAVHDAWAHVTHHATHSHSAESTQELQG
jgi:hypothetical protein